MNLAQVRLTLLTFDATSKDTNMCVSKIDLSSRHNSFYHYIDVDGEIKNKSCTFHINISLAGWDQTDIPEGFVHSYIDIVRDDLNSFRIYFLSSNEYKMYSINSNFTSSGFTMSVPRIGALQLINKYLQVVSSITQYHLDDFSNPTTVDSPVVKTTLAIMQD